MEKSAFNKVNISCKARLWMVMEGVMSMSVSTYSIASCNTEYHQDQGSLDPLSSWLSSTFPILNRQILNRYFCFHSFHAAQRDIKRDI